MKRFCAAVVMAAMLSGCAAVTAMTPEQKTEAVLTALRLGMSVAELVAAAGDPEIRYANKSADGPDETWVYSGGAVVIDIKGGVVVSATMEAK